MQGSRCGLAVFSIECSEMPMPKRLSDEFIREIHRFYRGDWTMKRLALRYRVSRQAIANVLQGLGSSAARLDLLGLTPFPPQPRGRPHIWSVGENRIFSNQR